MENVSPVAAFFAGVGGSGKTSVARVLEQAGYTYFGSPTRDWLAQRGVVQEQGNNYPLQVELAEYVIGTWFAEKLSAMEGTGRSLVFDRSPFCYAAYSHLLALRSGATTSPKFDASVEQLFVEAAESYAVSVVYFPPPTWDTSDGYRDQSETNNVVLDALTIRGIHVANEDMLFNTFIAPYGTPEDRAQALAQHFATLM